MSLKTQKALAKKAFYAGVGAPVVAGRLVKDAAGKLADQGTKLTKSAQSRFDELSKEGEKVTKQLRDTDVVEEIQSRVDFDKVQDRVEKMRDQLEGALESWRESFTPVTKPVAAKPGATKKAPASKPVAKKAPAAKATATKPVAKKAPAKTVAKKAPAKTAPVKPVAKKAPATTAAKK